MDKITYSRAMAAFCRQQAKFEQQNEQFWLSEATGWAQRFPEGVAARLPGQRVQPVAEVWHLDSARPRSTS